MIAQKTSAYLDIGDSKLYYEMAGEGEALVMIHAGFVDSGMWDAQWQALAQYFQVIRYDMRGFGRSSKLDTPVSRGAELEQLLKHLGIERAYLMGTSLGGEVALDFALQQPERVAALILVSAVPGGFELRGDPPPHLMDMMAAAQQGDTARASELQIRIWLDGMYRQPQQVDAAIRQQVAAMNRIAVENGTWAMDIQPPDPLDPPAVLRLSEVQVPTLVIVGALDHPEILRGADVISAEVQVAKQVVIPESAHLPNMEQPTVFNLAVIDFLMALQT